jgi:hypothetical protein
MGQNGALQEIVFLQETQICTVVTSSPAQDVCAHFPQCPQPTQISVHTEYNSLQYKHAVSSLSPEVELHCRDTLEFFVDFRKRFDLHVLFIVDNTMSCLYGDGIKTLAALPRRCVLLVLGLPVCGIGKIAGGEALFNAVVRLGF